MAALDERRANDSRVAEGRERKSWGGGRERAREKVEEE